LVFNPQFILGLLSVAVLIYLFIVSLSSPHTHYLSLVLLSLFYPPILLICVVPSPEAICNYCQRGTCTDLCDLGH